MIPNDLPPEKVRDFLEANADSIIKGKYFRPLDQSELDAARTVHADLSIDYADTDEHFNEEKKAMKETLKAKRENLAKVLKQIRQRGVEEEGKIYTLKDYDNHTVTEYSESGVQLNTRKMNPKERQTSVTDTHMRVANG